MTTRTAATAVLLRRLGALLLAALFLMTSTLAGCSPSTEEDHSPDLSHSVAEDLPEDASSSQRIAAALAAGEIDQPTSLLYRLWTQFGDRSLPAQYRGAPAPHDLSILSEIQDALESMPAEIRTQVEPFFERPSNPGSAFSGRGEASDPGAAANARAFAVRSVAQADDPDDDQRCSQDWVSRAVPGVPFRVWACPDEGNDVAERTIAAVSDVLGARVGEMVSDAPRGMGAPIPDEADADANQPSDDKVDVYVLPHGWFAPFRDLNERSMDEMAAAITMPAAPRTDNSTSAYILLASYLLDYPDPLERVLVHEVFHALQHAHFRADQSTAWLFEASAVWAETHFLPQLSEGSYGNRVSLMQDSQLSLLDEEFTHRYAAFLWFLFMEQQAGPEVVFGMWHALDSAPASAPSDSVVAAINSQLALVSAFPEFVMRLLNLALPGDPIAPRFVEIDPNFPDGEEPELPAQPLGGDSLSLDHGGIPGLGYRYTRVTLPDPAETGTSVRVSGDLATSSGTSSSIEALVERPDGDYARVRIDPSGSDLCVASELLLVVANPSGMIDDEITGAIDLIRGEGASCDAAPPAPSEPPSSATPPASPESDEGTADGTDRTEGTTGDFCTDMLRFQSEVQGLADATELPVSAQRVQDIFDLAEPYLPDLPGGGIGQVQTLRSYAEQAADQPASSAAAILDNEEFQRKTDAISFLVRFCDDAP